MLVGVSPSRDVHVNGRATSRQQLHQVTVSKVSRARPSDVR